MTLKQTAQSICILTVNQNTTTAIIIQVVHDDGVLLPCAINAACAAFVDAGIPMKHLPVAICCSLAESRYVILDHTKLEEEKTKAFAYLVFPNSVLSVLQKGLSLVEDILLVDDYFLCLKRGHAASAKLSEFLRRSLQSQFPRDSSKTG